VTLVDELQGQTADTGNVLLINQLKGLSGLIELAQLAVKLYSGEGMALPFVGGIYQPKQGQHILALRG
jgi:hypothetical protein